MARAHQEPGRTKSRRSTPWLIAGILTLGLLWAVWAWLRPSLTLPLGSLSGLTTGHQLFLKWYLSLGTIASLLLAIGFVTWPEQRLRAPFRCGCDRAWIAALCVAGLVLSLAAHLLVLQQMPVTDDESAYLFAARLVASGQVAVPSPPDKLFWDRAFMYNGGTFYPQYFLGWPALLAPFARLGLEGLANPVYFLLTVPPWFWLLRRATGSTWARLGTLLLVVSPMVLIASGTLMAHTSELCLLTWSFWAALRARDANAPWWTPALLATCFAGAFFNRPLTALGLATPILVLWAVSVVRGRRWRQLPAFLVPTLALAILFFLVNLWQNGAPTSVGYQRVLHYSMENDYRFSYLPVDKDVGFTGLRLRDPGDQVRLLAASLARVTVAAFGWPFALALLVPLPLRRPAVRLHAVVLLCFLASHAFVEYPGVDTFGPSHFFELMLPLTALLMAVGHDWQESGKRILGLGPWPLVWAGLVVSLSFYTPLRLLTVHSITSSIRQAPELTASLHDAIVYVPYGEWAPQCDTEVPRHHLFWRPNPRPDWSDSVLYANHLSVEKDRTHRARHFPERAAYVLHKEEHAGTCSLRLLDLDSPHSDQVPPGRQTYRR